MANPDLEAVARTRPLHLWVERTVASWQDEDVRIAWAVTPKANPDLVEARLLHEDAPKVLRSLLAHQDVTYREIEHLLDHPDPDVSLAAALHATTPDEAALEAVRRAYQRPHAVKRILRDNVDKVAKKPSVVRFALAHQDLQAAAILAHARREDLDVVYRRLTGINATNQPEVAYLMEAVHLPWGEKTPQVRQLVEKHADNLTPDVAENFPTFKDELLDVLDHQHLRYQLEDPATRGRALEELRRTKSTPGLRKALARVRAEDWTTSEHRAFTGPDVDESLSLEYSLAAHYRREDLQLRERMDLLAIWTLRKITPGQRRLHSYGRSLGASPERDFVYKNLTENLHVLLTLEHGVSLEVPLNEIVKGARNDEIHQLHEILWGTEHWARHQETFLTAELPWETLQDLPARDVITSNNRTRLYHQALLELTPAQVEIFQALGDNIAGTCQEVLDALKTIQ